MAKLLSWTTSERPSGNFVAHGFPSSFQLNPNDVTNGAVRVVAKSPSGQAFPMEVVDNEGVYATNFTPTVIGDWLISILYEGDHIQGSPFSVRVYDPGLVRVAGLMTGLAGRPYSFSVDTSGAGDGQVAVDVLREGRSFPVRIFPDNFGRHMVHFTPDVSGKYELHIYFAGLELSGSPFAVDVVDSSEVAVSGDGLGLVAVDRPASFTLSTPRTNAGTAQLQVIVNSPRGVKTSPDIVNLRDGTHLVEYIPREIGPHMIDVLYHSQNIIGSPFVANAYDVSQIGVSGIRPAYLPGDMVQFDIDVSKAGIGNIEIMVNKGKLPCSVSNLGNRKFRASFTPKEPERHSIDIKFNGQDVPGSPWFIDVKGSKSKFTISQSTIERVQVGRLARMDLNLGGSSGNITANVIGPSGQRLVSNIRSRHSGHYSLEYTPLEIGVHTINVQLDGKPVSGSPFSSRVFSTAAITVDPVPSGVVGSPVEFTVDVSKAGEGKLEIMVNRGAVPNSVRSVSRGVYEVSFVPRTSQIHVVDITFNGQPLPGGPIMVPVIDQSKVTITGSGVIQAAVNQNSSFHVNTQSAGNADLKVIVTSLLPGGQAVPAVIKGTPSKGYDVEFVTRQTGNYRVDVEYGGAVVRGSPFIVKSFDISKVKVLGISDGIVGQTSSFTTDVTDAGEGNMELSIVSSSGRNIQNDVQKEGSNRFRVSYTPSESGQHKANITFNKQHIPGSPFSFCVNDSSKVAVQGSGLETVPCNKLTSFNVTSPGLQQKDLSVQITGPNGHPVSPRIYSTGSNSFTVEYTPTTAGDYEVAVSCFGHPVAKSPFLCHAWDSSKVVVSNVQSGRVFQQTKFAIDASNAGRGNLETVVTCDLENVPNFVTADGDGHYSVSFTPLKASTHVINVRFNGEPVPGSPFYHSVLDGRRAVASGEGLGNVLVRRPASFDVKAHGVGGEAELLVEVLDPNGESVSSQVSKSGISEYRVVYTPKMIGRHTANIRYADADITGSPFHPNVYDPGCVRVVDLSDGVFGKPVTFKIDTIQAGEGHLAAKIRGQGSQPYVDILERSSGEYAVTFEPHESGLHQIYVYFNDIQVIGSPFECIILDADVLTAKRNSSRPCAANKPVQFELETRGALHRDVTAKVTDPYGKAVNSHIVAQGNRKAVEFLPSEVGPHLVEVFYGSEPIKGSPFTLDVYDATRVKLLDIPNAATAGQEVAFVVDAGEAGSGDVDVQVRGGSSTVPTRRDRISEFRQRFSFVPTSSVNHTISVAFNDETVIGCPISLKVKSPVDLVEVSNPHSQEGIVVGSPGTLVINTRGGSINLSDIVVNITSPNGETLPSRVVEQSDGSYRIEYMLCNSGRHKIEIFYNNEPIRGTPFYVEAFDPSRIQINGKTSWFVGETVQIDINQVNAGKSDVGVTVTGPRGAVPFDVFSTPHGHQITYVPMERGQYQVHVTYGGRNIPGSPLVHNIADPILATVSGQGLIQGNKDKMSTFSLDPKGQKGDLVVQVDGPNSIAKCNIESTPSGTYRINYVPVEVGIYNIIVQWNGKPVQGSPFRPVITDPSKVDVVGGWQSILNSNGCFPLTAYEKNSITFTSKHAGPGQLSAEVNCRDAVIPVEVTQIDPDHFLVSFIPHSAGEYLVKVFWNNVPLPRSPIIGTVATPSLGRHRASPSASAASFDSDKVILTGQGLHHAKVNQRADFVVDGTEAGNGSPVANLVGSNGNVNVQCVPLGGQKYHCSYVALQPGAYLLNIMWSNRPIRGSPYKVTVASGSNASRVTCVGDGLSSGVVGQELKTTIDTRRAGSGELVAQCVGPTKMALCELVDHRDGTFALYIKPQEPGRHVLEIKYGDERIPGSPFIIRVSGSPDASKVTARGPGLQHGTLAKYRSYFAVDTSGAGAGQLTVRVRGPKDAFHVEMQRDKQHDRTIICRYDPTEVGDYVIHIKWSGVHVPGSPFHVRICGSEPELEKFKAENAYGVYDPHLTTPSPHQHDTYEYSE